MENVATPSLKFTSYLAITSPFIASTRWQIKWDQVSSFSSFLSPEKRKMIRTKEFLSWIRDNNDTSSRINLSNLPLVQFSTRDKKLQCPSVGHFHLSSLLLRGHYSASIRLTPRTFSIRNNFSSLYTQTYVHKRNNRKVSTILFS